MRELGAKWPLWLLPVQNPIGDSGTRSPTLPGTQCMGREPHWHPVSGSTWYSGCSFGKKKKPRLSVQGVPCLLQSPPLTWETQTRALSTHCPQCHFNPFIPSSTGAVGGPLTPLGPSMPGVLTDEGLWEQGKRDSDGSKNADGPHLEHSMCRDGGENTQCRQP